MRSEQLKQMMYEAKHWFVENKFAEYADTFETPYTSEINEWLLFNQYVRDIKDYDIIDMFIFDEEQDGDVQAFRSLVDNECDKVIYENHKVMFPATSRIRLAS